MDNIMMGSDVETCGDHVDIQKRRKYRTMTDYQLLLKIVPDFEERLKRAEKEQPEVVAELKATVHLLDGKGWRPLQWWNGCL